MRDSQPFNQRTDTGRMGLPSCAKCNYRKGTRTSYPPIKHPWMRDEN